MVMLEKDSLNNINYGVLLEALGSEAMTMCELLKKIYDEVLVYEKDNCKL